MAVVVGPDLEPHEVSLDQVAPGVYEKDLGEIDSGAYAVRITPDAAGAPALGRTVGLVEPVAGGVPPARREPAVPRGAARGNRRREIVLPADPWIHDLKMTSSFTELWPWLLMLALLLWPLDIALRRVVARAARARRRRAWVGRRWRRAGARRRAPRRPRACSPSRERAGGGAARAALLRRPDEAPSGPAGTGARPCVPPIRAAGADAVSGATPSERGPPRP